MEAPATQLQIILTCEHGGNAIPRSREFIAAFSSAGARRALASHRGWDPGALPAARRLAAALGAPLLHAATSRLLVDLNRSPGHPRLYSQFSHALPPESRERIRREHYEPFRAAALAVIAAAANLPNGPAVLHISVHSFTPVMNGERRDCDVGILYDPRRRAERAFAGAWRAALLARSSRRRVRLNVPYHGTADGHTTALRRLFPADRYLGIELEINQRFWRKGPRSAAWRSIVSDIEHSLLAITRPGAAGGPDSRARLGRVRSVGVRT